MSSEFTPSHRGGEGEPLVCIHGFTDIWRTWELVLPELEKHHDVFAFTLPGHAGGPPLEGGMTELALLDQVDLVTGRGDQLHVGIGRQRAADRRTHHATVAGNEDPPAHRSTDAGAG